MAKRIVTVLLIVLMVGQVEVGAQSFLKELGKEVQKAAQKKKTNQAPAAGKPSQGQRPADSRQSEKARQSDQYRKSVESAQPDKEKRSFNIPPKDHAMFFEPLGYPNADGGVEWVCPAPPAASKDWGKWAEGLKPVTSLSCESLVKEMELLEPRFDRGKDIINAIIARYDDAQGELFARAGAINDYVEALDKVFDPTRNEAQKETPVYLLARVLGLDAYKRMLNSSIVPLRQYVNDKSIAYIEKYGGFENAHKAERTKWAPYNDEAQVSEDGAAVGTLSADGKSVDVEGMSFKIFLKTADGDFFRLMNVNKPALEGKDVVIPSRIMYKGKSYPVTEIGSSAFLGAGAKSILIPNTVRKIEKSAFGSLPYVKNIEIPSSVKLIGDFCFSKCAELTEIKIPDSVTKIGSFAFSECPKLTTVTLPKNLKAMGEQTFKGCPMLKNVALPENLAAIPDRFFSGCKALASITIPQTVTSIGYAAFENCSGLGSIELPSSLNSIGSEAFKNCSKLTALYIPASVKEIDTMTVKGCKSLKTITMNKAYNNFYVLVGIFGGCEIFPESYYSTASIPAAFKFVD